VCGFLPTGQKTTHKELKFHVRPRPILEIGEHDQQKGLDIHTNLQYYHFDVNVKVEQAL